MPILPLPIRPITTGSTSDLPNASPTRKPRASSTSTQMITRSNVKMMRDASRAWKGVPGSGASEVGSKGQLFRVPLMVALKRVSGAPCRI
jgi:hypothetical protein